MARGEGGVLVRGYGSAGAGEVGDFVLVESVGGEGFERRFVEAGYGVVGGDQIGVVAGTAGEKFAAEAGVFVDFKHVDAGVGGAGFGEDGEGFLPGGEGLPGEAGEQIEVDVGDACGAEAGEVVEDDGAGVEAAGGGGFLVDEGLYAEGDAVDAGGGEGGEGFVGDLAGGALDGDFGVGGEAEVGAHGGEEAGHVRAGEDGRSASAEVHGVHGARQVNVHAGGPLGSGGHVGDEAVDVACVFAGGVDTGGEVAVGALGATEGDGEVEPERVVRCGRHRALFSHFWGARVKRVV